VQLLAPAQCSCSLSLSFCSFVFVLCCCCFVCVYARVCVLGALYVFAPIVLFPGLSQSDVSTLRSTRVAILRNDGRRCAFVFDDMCISQLWLRNW